MVRLRNCRRYWSGMSISVCYSYLCRKGFVTCSHRFGVSTGQKRQGKLVLPSGRFSRHFQRGFPSWRNLSLPAHGDAPRLRCTVILARALRRRTGSLSIHRRTTRPGRLRITPSFPCRLRSGPISAGKLSICSTGRCSGLAAQISTETRLAWSPTRWTIRGKCRWRWSCPGKFIGAGNWRVGMVCAIAAALSVCAMAAQPSGNLAPGWSACPFLIDEWVGEGGGEPGQGTGGFSFQFDLDLKIIVRKNRADIPLLEIAPHILTTLWRSFIQAPRKRAPSEWKYNIRFPSRGKETMRRIASRDGTPSNADCLVLGAALRVGLRAC